MQQMGMEGGVDMENTAKTEERTWKDRIKRNLRPLLFGLLAGAGGALLLLVLFAAAMGAMHLTLAAIPWLARIIGAAGGFAAGFFAARSRKKRGLVIGGCAGAVLGGCFLVLGLCVSGAIPAMQAITKLLLCGAAGMVGGVLGVGSGTGVRR